MADILVFRLYKQSIREQQLIRVLTSELVTSLVTGYYQIISHIQTYLSNWYTISTTSLVSGSLCGITIKRYPNTHILNHSHPVETWRDPTTTKIRVVRHLGSSKWFNHFLGATSRLVQWFWHWHSNNSSLARPIIFHPSQIILTKVLRYRHILVWMYDSSTNIHNLPQTHT